MSDDARQFALEVANLLHRVFNDATAAAVRSAAVASVATNYAVGADNLGQPPLRLGQSRAIVVGRDLGSS